MELLQTLPLSRRVQGTRVLLIDETRGKVLRHARRALYNGSRVKASPRRGVRVPLGRTVVHVDLLLQLEREGSGGLHAAIPWRRDYLLWNRIFARRGQEDGEVVGLVQAVRRELGLAVIGFLLAVVVPLFVRAAVLRMLPEFADTVPPAAPIMRLQLDFCAEEGGGGHSRDGRGSDQSAPSAIRPAASWLCTVSTILLPF